jgi:hypothetical protein
MSTGLLSNTRQRALCFALLAALPLASPAQPTFSGSYPLLDGDVIRYQNTPPNDVVARLQRRLDEGSTKLRFQEEHGYLLSVLQALNIPISSQMLVFSKTSSQQKLISPSTPRAIYFNDSVYVGWVQGGKELELAAVDPSQGTMFYTLDQRAMTQPQFVRRQECLQCHAAPATLGVPGLLMRSTFCAADGSPELHAALFTTDHRSPLKQRWGGWYVTGTYGPQRHMGNVWFKDKEHPEWLDREGGANLTSLTERFNVTAYATPHSDVVALLILAHQTYLHNLITRVNWETRLALHDQASMEKALGPRAETWSESTRNRIHNAVEILLHGMLFTDEAGLGAQVQGTSDFSSEFMASAPQDSLGRSLRALDMNRRMFRYPCSFLIYSEAFDALPPEALDYFYRRLWDILTGKDEDGAFATLTQSDRKAILSILLQTKANLPRYWRGERTRLAAKR